MFIVVNFDVLAQASDFLIERRQVAIPLLNAEFEPRVSGTKSQADNKIQQIQPNFIAEKCQQYIIEPNTI